MGQSYQEKKEIREKYQPILINLIEEVGVWNINILELSREWEIPKTTLHRWKDTYLKNKGPLDLDELISNAPENLKSNIKFFQRKLRGAETARERALMNSSLNASLKTLTEFLENFGLKKKIADKQDLHVTGDKLSNINIRIITPEEAEKEDSDAAA